MSKIHTVLDRVNVPKMVTTWALGERHHPVSRLLAGALIMVLGVLLSRLPEACEWHGFLVRCGADLVGFGIHGVGLTPFLEALIRAAREEV